MNLFAIKEYLHATGSFPEKLEIRGMKLDSRDIEPGDLFIVIGKGISYIDEAVSLGAVAVLTDQDIKREDIPILKVEDILVALGLLGKKKRESFSGKVIAITGSNGKTTTKEILKFLLSFDKKVLANKESENNHIGVPKTLLELDDSYDYVLLEMGMNHRGELRYLSRIAKPDMGIITNIGTNHIGNLGSKEEILKAKMEMVEENPSMMLFVNGLDPYLKQVNGILVLEEYPSFHGVPAIDISLACALLETLGYTKEELTRRLFSFPGVKYRMEEMKVGDLTIINDAYNASLESFQYALEELDHLKGRKIIVLGDFLELGSYSASIHQKLKEEIEKRDIYLYITYGEEIQVLNHQPHFFQFEELKEYLQHFSYQKGDILYFKASHKMGLYKLASYLKNTCNFSNL